MLSSKELVLAASKGEKHNIPPIWFMRQAGRYLPEYRNIRQQVKFLELCRNPELAAEVSVQPIEIFGLDAAIIFSDILLPLADFNLELEFPDTGGIKISGDLEIDNFEIGENISATCQAIKILKNKLQNKNLEVAVLGFAGAPWTLANYILEGGTRSATLKGEFGDKAKKQAWLKPTETKALMHKLSLMTINYLKAQIEAGVDAIQLFDTWAGELSETDFIEFVLPSLKFIFSELPADLPKILYIKGISPYIQHLADCGASILSIDWKTSLTQASLRLETNKNNKIVALQGNLDPLILTLDNPEIVKTQTQRIICEGRELKNYGHIMNLGHGVTPQAKVENVKAFIQATREC